MEQWEKPVIVIIDEFQQITKYPEKNTEAVLRSYMQRMRNATFVFAGSEQTILQEMFVSSKRPFYNSSEIITLGPIEEDVYVDFARNLFAERGKTVDEEPVRWAIALFDGNTFYLQRTMNGAFADTPEGAVCDMVAVNRSVRSMLASNEVVYREILSNVTVSQKAVLYAIARSRIVENPMSSAFVRDNALPSSSSVQSALLKLIKSGLVSKTERGYSLTDPLLRIFINGLYATPELDMSGF